MRQEREKMEVATLELCIFQLNENLEAKIKESTKRINKIHTSSKKGLHTRCADVHNQSTEKECAFEPRRISCREVEYLKTKK
jgi:hypothetical protein